MSMSKRVLTSLVVVALVGSLLSLVAPGAAGVGAVEAAEASAAGVSGVVPTRVYSSSLDFSAGDRVNVADLVPDQLQLDETTRVFGFFWVALSNRGTVAKIDTATGEVLGEYRSAPAGRATDPSRTTVDKDGNVWVGNRAEGSGGRGSVVHLGLEENGQCSDRNGNGQIDTSTGLGDIKGWANTGGVDNAGGVSTATDECIVHYVRTAGTAIRHVSVNPSNDVWVGGPHGAGKLELLSSDGVSLRVINMALPADTGETGGVSCCYGGLVDPQGVVWTATAGGSVVRIDPAFPNGHPDLVRVVAVRFSYGMGLDVDGNIWVSNWTADGVQKISPAGVLLGTFPTTSGSNDRGVVGTPDGDVWVASSGRDRVTRFSNTGVIEAVIPVGNQPTGVAVDQQGKVWSTNLSSHDVTRIDPATNTTDLTVDLRVAGLANPGPYNYSDMTGSTLSGRPDQGTWRVVHDGGSDGAQWPLLSWSADEPGDGSVRVMVASSDDGVAFGPTVEAVNGEVPAVDPGRYLRIEVRFARAGTGESPVLYDLTIGATNQAPVAVAGPDQVVVEGATVQIDGSASTDPDGDPLSSTWRLLRASGPPVTLSSTTNAAVAFGVLDDGVYDLELTVSDGREASSDVVRVTVANAEPTLQGRLDTADAGGVSLLTASFTDGGPIDTHAATVDWGDGSPVETVAVSAQGTGWGSVLASHVYPDAGTFVASVTVIDDDGGTASVALDEVAVSEPVGLFAGSTTASDGLWVSGSSVTIDGATHSNADIRVSGAAKNFAGPTTYVRTLRTSGQHTFDPAAAQVAVQDPPVAFPLDDYRPGGRAAVAAGAGFFDMSAACAASNGNQGWRPPSPLAPGLYWVPCNVTISGSGFAAGPVTLASTGTIKMSGSSGELAAPYVDGVVAISGRSGGNAIDISGSGSIFAGYVLAPAGHIDITGSGHRFSCAVVGNTVRISGSGTQIVASDCSPPVRTTAPPLLVPRLDIGLGQTPADVEPGATLTDTAVASNAGAVLLVPTVVGIENLAAGPVTVSGATIALERWSVTDASWVPVAGTPTIAARPNPHPGTTGPTGPDPFAGVIVDPGSLGTWGVEVQTELPPLVVAQLLDPAQTAAVRLRSEVTVDPAGASVRPLWRFGDDLTPQLAAAGADLTDVALVLVAPDGSVRTYDPTTHPELARIAPGAAATISLTTPVAIPEAMGITETTDAYLARLAGLDGDSLVAAAWGRAATSIGGVLGPQRLATSTRHLPIVVPTLTGPPTSPSGAHVTLDIALRNAGSAPALALAIDGAVDTEPTPVTDAPVVLAPFEVATATMAHTVADDHPGGTLRTDLDVSWTDANTNAYGPASRRTDIAIGGKPSVAATLTDALVVDADGSGQPSPGDTLAYTTLLANMSGAPLVGATFTLPAPANTTLVAGTAATTAGTVTSGTAPGDPAVVVDLGVVPALAFAIVTVHVTVNAPFPDGVASVIAQGTVTADGTAPVVTDDPARVGDTDPTETPITRAEAALGATLDDALIVDRDGDGKAGLGDTIRYTARIDQLGNAPVDTVTVAVAPPASTALVIGSVTTNRGTVTAGNNAGDAAVSVDVGTLPTFTAAAVTFDVVIVERPASGSVSVQGTVTSATLAPVLTDDPATATVGDPTITELAGGPGGPDDQSSGPTVESCTLADGQTVTEPTALACTLVPRDATTAQDWTVTVGPAGPEPTTDQDTVLAVGTGTDLAATIDPTVLANGIWTLTITTSGSDGGITRTETSIVIDGQLKLGRYSVTYQDMAVPVGGIPIQVNRTYDTLNRNRQGDFGYGWDLEVANFRVQTNRPLGDGGWEQYSCGGGFIFVPLCYRTTRPHYTTVTWPDGRTETFDFTPKGLNTFFSTAAIPAYTGRPNTTSKLEPAPGDLNAGNRSDGNLYAGSFGEGGIYNPTRFVLVAKDGTRYLLDVNTGLVEATDRNANKVTVTAEGITSSSGPGIVFDRDGDGRIEKVTGPDGADVEYRYDGVGDLDLVLDQKNRETSFSYEGDHYLVDTDDPGPGLFRRLGYHPDGRLASITDANNHTTNVAVTLDPDTRSERVTSPDGRLNTRTTFDERGNVVERDDVFADPTGDSHVTAWSYSDDGRDLITSRTDPAGNTWEATYDDDGNVEVFTDAEQATTRITYDEFGAPTSIIDANQVTSTYTYDSATGNLTDIDEAGRAQRLDYDSRGNPTRHVDGLNREQTWTYTPAGFLASHIDANRKLWRYRTDPMGRVEAEIDPANRETVHDYDEVGNLISTVRPMSLTRQWGYDAVDRLVSSTDEDNHTTTYGYDDAGNQTRITDPLLHPTAFAYDAQNRLIATTDPLDRITRYGYDGGGRLETVTDPLLRVTTYGYDRAGRQNRVSVPGRGPVVTTFDGNGLATSVTNGESETVHYAHDPVGQLEEIRDALERRTTFDYDDRGNRTDVTNPAGERTRYDYDAADQLTMVTAGIGPLGVTGIETTSFEYDANGNPTVTRDGTNRATTTEYDERNLARFVRDSAGHPTEYRYDDAGRLTQTINAAGITTDYGYDGRSNQISITDSLGNTTNTGYDPAGRLVTQTDGRRYLTTYGYNAASELISIRDARGGQVSFGYDNAGQRTRVTDPNEKTRTSTYTPAGDLETQVDALDRVTSFGYDLAGRQTSRTDARTLTTAYGYDDAGQLTGELRQEPGGALTAIVYGYDNTGRRTTVTDPTGTTTVAYDPASRITQVAAPQGTIDYGYDAAGRRTSMTLPAVAGAAGGTVTYTHDPVGRVQTISEPGRPAAATAIAYTLDGRRTTVTRPNGVTSSYSYDPAGRGTGMTYHGPTGEVARFVYTLDANGNRTAVRYAYEGGPETTETYTLDELDRLTGAAYSDTGQADTYAYDNAGNRTTKTSAGGAQPGTTNYHYDDAQQLTATDGTAVPGEAEAFTYDANGNLTAATTGDEFTYDAANQMTAATVDGVATDYAYDANGVRVAAEGNPQLYDTTNGLPTLVNDATGTQTVHGAGGVLTQDTPGSSTYPVADALGSIRGQTNNAGDLTGTANYDAYGTPRGAAIPGSFGYTGEQTDTTGLVNLRARMYDPSFGRFQSADSVQPNAAGTQGWSLYSYAEANPGTLVDPSGHMSLATYSKQSDDARKEISVLAGPKTAVKEAVAPTLARYGITLFIRVMITTLAECLLGTPISPWAGSFSLSAPLVGFVCAPQATPIETPTEVEPGPDDEPDDPDCPDLEPWKTRPAAGTSPAYEYQRRVAGPTETQIAGSSGVPKIWADGPSPMAAFAIDAKFVGDASSSPFVPGSSIPDAIRAQIMEDQEDEFSRYGAVLRDPCVPVKFLTVKTNNPLAVSTFQDLLIRHGVPGSVVVEP